MSVPGIYIPYVLDGYTFPVLHNIFANKYKIGIIRHIDYVYSKHKFTDAGKPVRSAFVHFEKWFDNDFVRYLWKQLETIGKYNLSNYTTYLKNTSLEHSNCAGCINSHDLHIMNMSSPEQIDNIVLMIQRPKNPVFPIESPVVSIPKNVPNVESRPFIPEEIRDILEKHERRIELLEDELRVLTGR